MLSDSDDGKKFCDIEIRGQCYKFFVRDLRIFLKKLECLSQASVSSLESIVCGQDQEPTPEWTTWKILH